MPLQFNHISWLGLQFVTLMLAALPLFISWPLPDDVFTLSQAQLGSTGTNVELPDDWRSRSYSGQQEVYQFNLMLEQAPLETWALLLPSVNLRAQVKLNNHPLTHNENDYNSSTARMWFQPLLYPLSSELLQRGSNQLQITISNAATHGYLATPLVGTYTALAGYTVRSQLLRKTLLQIIVIAMSVVALLMLFLWLQRRQDVIYGLYGLGMLCWAAHDLNFIVTNPVLPAHYWDAFSVLALGGFITATTFFIHRYLGLKRPRIEHAILWFSLLGAPLLFLLPPPALQIFSDYIWHPVIMSSGLYLYLLMYIHAWRQPGFELQLMAMTGSVMVLYGGHDTLIKLGFLPWDLGYMLPYSAATSLLVFSSLLVNRFAKNLDAMEGISRDLDQRIKAAAEVIENNRIKLRDHDRERLLSAERERVARDIHDGVGGQLIALLSLIRGGHYSVKETENSLIQAMHDLRLVIESLDVAEGDLGTALASWRHRLQRRLSDSGMQLIWKPSEVKRLKNFGPSDILQVLRLLDEAANNALNHSNASTLTVEYGMLNEQFFIELSDNGRGGAHSNPQGRGIPNMQHRAGLLGSILQIETGQHGTRIRLLLNQSVPTE